MKVAKSLGFGLALSFLLTLGSNAHAEIVSFVTTGTFTGGDLAGSNTYLDAANGISIVFNSSIDNTVDVPPTSQVSFGQFDSSATTATSLTPVASNFLLDIFQTAPTAGSLEFVGQLQGSLQVLNSQAYIQFSEPLVGQIGRVFYQIASADGGMLGRVNLAPPSTNSGLTTIVGNVGIVPEPASLVIMSLGCPALLVVGYRNRRRQLAVAA